MKNDLKKWRQFHGFTQEQMAKSISVSRQTINSIEKGRYVPSTVLSLKIAALFSKKVEDIFELEDED
jgi:putative transcriptional regulator